MKIPNCGISKSMYSSETDGEIDVCDHAIQETNQNSTDSNLICPYTPIYKPYQMTSAEQSYIYYKNVKDFKQLKKDTFSYKWILSIFRRIAEENDINAMLYGIKEEYCYVKFYDGRDILAGIAMENNFKLSHMMIECGANHEYHKNLQINDFSFFCANGNFDAVRYFMKLPDFDINAPANELALISAVSRNHVKIVRTLITIPGIRVNKRDSLDWTALMYASRAGYLDIVKMLVSFPEIDINAHDKYGTTALMFAAKEGHHEIVKYLLLVLGIDINKQNLSGWTALMYAAECGHLEVVKVLMSVPEIDISITNKDGFTASMLAKRKNY